MKKAIEKIQNASKNIVVVDLERAGSVKIYVHNGIPDFENCDSYIVTIGEHYKTKVISYNVDNKRFTDVKDLIYYIGA